MAFPNSFYASLRPVGQMENMPIVQKEVVLMLQPERANEFPETDPNAPIKFGAKDVQDLSWKNLMDAYSCSECGRCTAACPANQTGKKLSPRKVMMDTRDRLEEVGLLLEKNAEVPVEGNLLDRISVEELRACTTCNACFQACPLNISPLDIILQLRRSLVMEDSNVPNEWAMMFGNLENNQGPWKFSNEDRANWRNA
jgi:Fe-S oxidoreductase